MLARWLSIQNVAFMYTIKWFLSILGHVSKTQLVFITPAKKYLMA